MILEILKNDKLLFNAVASVAIVTALWLIRMLLIRSIRNSNLPIDSRRKWIAFVKSISLLAALTILVIVWAAQIRNVALSLAALAVALVLATKELILCISGGLLKTSNRSFEIGDRIEIKNLRGDVISQNMFCTTLVEIGPGKTGRQYTGRKITLPNSIFLEHPVINEHLCEGFSLHTFRFTLDRDQDALKGQIKLLHAAQEECNQYIEKTKKQLGRLTKDIVIDMPSVEPRVSFDFSKHECVDLIIRVPCPTAFTNRIEQAIFQRYLNSSLETKSSKTSKISRTSSTV